MTQKDNPLGTTYHITTKSKVRNNFDRSIDHSWRIILVLEIPSLSRLVGIDTFLGKEFLSLVLLLPFLSVKAFAIWLLISTVWLHWTESKSYSFGWILILWLLSSTTLILLSILLWSGRIFGYHCRARFLMRLSTVEAPSTKSTMNTTSCSCCNSVKIAKRSL